MSKEYDIADPNDPNTLVVPFMFVPHGCEPTPEWLRDHPGAIRIPAVMVPRDPQPGESGTQWNVRLDLLDEPATAPPAAHAPAPQAGFAPVARPGAWPVDRHGRPWPRSRFGQPMCPIHELPPGVRKPGEAPGPGQSYDVMRDAIAAWRAAGAVFADPGRFAGIGVSDPHQRGVQYADARRDVRTDAAQTEAPPRPVYIFVGGFNDEVDQNVKRYYGEFKAKHPMQAFYFSWTDAEGIKNFIAGLPKGTPVNLIGHSYGGDTAAKVVAKLDQKINMLITVDPLSWTRPNFADVRSHTNVWLDVDATPRHDELPTKHNDLPAKQNDLSNVAAGIGGDWGSSPKDAATMYIETVANHKEFTRMMQTKGPGGRSPEEILLAQ